MEIVGIVLFFACLAVLAWRSVQVVDGPFAALGVALAAVTGFIVADLLSGLAHWAGDTVGDETTPLFGKHFVMPFRQHHGDAKAITRHDFIETNGNSCIVSVPVLLGLLVALPSETTFLFFFCVTMGFAAWFLFCTNQFHKWAHADNPPQIVKSLQHWGVILSPEHHARHHAVPHDKYYCITVGWLNPLLTKIRFFRACESFVAMVYPSFLHLEERHREMAAQALQGSPHSAQPES